MQTGEGQDTMRDTIWILMSDFDLDLQIRFFQRGLCIVAQQPVSGINRDNASLALTSGIIHRTQETFEQQQLSVALPITYYA